MVFYNARMPTGHWIYVVSQLKILLVTQTSSVEYKYGLYDMVLPNKHISALIYWWSMLQLLWKAKKHMI